MAITANGMIAKENDNTDWVSPTEGKSFIGMIQKAGNMIIGRRTYEVMLNNDEFRKLKKIRIIVISRKLKTNKEVTVVNSPREAIHFLQQQRFSIILVCGGGKLNACFMKEKLINEIYLDVEPIILGAGIKLFADAEFEAKLELMEVQKLSRNEVQLHYKVKDIIK
mgnify:FL=1